MMFAEVIGDPIAQSKSPIIHKYWLERIGLEGDYLRTQVAADDLPAFVARRFRDCDWRGSNVTIPHKEKIIPLLAGCDAGAAAIGAVNCVVPRGDGLFGYNTDIDGVAAALDGTRLAGAKVAVIGAGGGARAVVAYLAGRGVGHITVLARDPAKAEALRGLADGIEPEAVPLGEADRAFDRAAAIVNASPLGMVGTGAMPSSLLEALGRHAAGATVFDMVTTPAETPFLLAGTAGGAQVVDGLTMLVGQARRAFELLFGHPAPASDRRLRDLLVT